MASINFIQPAYTNDQKKYLYSDVHLDIIEDKSTIGTNNSDIQADYDIDAIKNSIHNLFNTKKGERILTPEFGISLENYLFEPITANTKYNIGREIENGITRFEPRVILREIKITTLDTEDGYEILISLYIPKININTVVSTSLTQNGFKIK